MNISAGYVEAFLAKSWRKWPKVTMPGTSRAGKYAQANASYYSTRIAPKR